MAGLFVHQGALGDWVITWPMLRALVDHCGMVFAVTPGQKARLAARFIEGVAPVDIEAGWHQLHQPKVAAPPPLPISFSELTCVISFVATGSDPWAANIRRFAPQAQVAFVQPRPPEHWHDHVLGWQYDQLDRQLAIALGCEDPPPRLNPEGPVVVHPGSGGAAKCWPREHFHTLIRRLEADRPVKVVLGEVELETWPKAVIEQWQRDFDVVMPQTLDALADVLLEASLIVANDSGPMHLADQLGKPVLALFGPSNLRHWRPTGERAATKIFSRHRWSSRGDILGPDQIYPLAKIWLEMSNYP